MSQARHFETLLAQAWRHARRGFEAEDVVQEVLIAAVEAGRADLSVPENRRWALGAVRRRAAFDARSAARRRNRERSWAEGRPAEVPAETDAVDVAAILVGLPPSLRVVAALALSGHNRHEIAYLLGLPDTALRQRVKALKSALERKGITMPPDMAGLNLALAYGAIRDALLPALIRHGGVRDTRPGRSSSGYAALTKRLGAATGGVFIFFQGVFEMPIKLQAPSLVFYVSDIVRTEAFYRDVLGIETRRQEGAEPFWMTADFEGGFQVIFFQQDGRRGDTPALVFDLRDGGIDDVVAALAEQGVVIVTPVSEAPGGWSADFLDPDGFGLGLWQAGELPRSLN